MMTRQAPSQDNPLVAQGAQSLNVRSWLVVWTLCQRELVRFVRQRNRVFGAVGQPIIFWLLLSEGFSSVKLDYLFFFPGTLAMILLFTAIYTTISIIEDRREGFLQSVLVAPIPRWSMVLGKVLGGSIIALIQALLFLLLGLTLGLTYSFISLLALTGFMFLLALALTSLGMCIAWRMESTQGFHVIMNVVLMPMWLLSGAFFPANSGHLVWIGKVNPLTYGVAGLRHLLYSDAPAHLSVASQLDALPSLPLCWAVMLLFTAITFALAWKISAQRITGDLL